jgi:hypothetical protein
MLIANYLFLISAKSERISAQAATIKKTMPVNPDWIGSMLVCDPEIVANNAIRYGKVKNKNKAIIPSVLNFFAFEPI